jgi:hypothetical protein
MRYRTDGQRMRRARRLTGLDRKPQPTLDKPRLPNHLPGGISMGNTVFGVAVDSTDAATLAGFWAQVLGRQVADGATAEHVVLTADADPAHGPRLAFHRVPEPKTSKNRLHLDLIAADFDAETARLLALGATRLNNISQGQRTVTSSTHVERRAAVSKPSRCFQSRHPRCG